MFFFCSPKHTYSTCHGLELLTPWICSTETQFFLLLIATQHKNINKENRKAWIRIGYLNVQCIWRRYNKRISKPVKSSQAPLCKNGKNDRSSYLTIYIYIFFFLSGLLLSNGHYSWGVDLYLVRSHYENCVFKLTDKGIKKIFFN